MPKLEGFDKIADWDYLTEIEREELMQREGKDFNEKAAEAARNSPRVKQAARKAYEGGEAEQRELEAAFTEEYEGQPVVTLHISDDTEGERTEVFTVGQFNKALNREGSVSEITETIRNSYEVVAGFEKYGGGLVELDVHPPVALFDFESIPLSGFLDAGLQPGRYFVLTGADVGDDWSKQEVGDLNAAVMEKDGLLLATSADQIRGEAEPQAVTIKPHPKADFEPLELWTTTNSEGEYLGLQDLIHGLLVIATIKHLVDKGDIIRGTEPLDVLPKLATQSTAKVRNHLRPITKVYQKITDPELFNPDRPTAVNTAGESEKRRGKQILTAISLSYEGEGLNISTNLSRTDTNIHDAIVSLYAAGATTFTTRQVFSVLTGNNTTNPKEEKLAEIEESLDKQRRTFVKLDFSNELRGREAMFEGEPITEYKRESFMLDASKETIKTAKGTEATGYVLHSAPILYMHAALVGQVATYPQRLLTAMQEAGSNTNTNIAVRQYLLTRIEQAKNSTGRMSSRIRYDTIFEEAELQNLNRTQKKRHVDHIKKCLDILTKEGYIKSYSEYKEKRAAVGIELYL